MLSEFGGEPRGRENVGEGADRKTQDGRRVATFVMVETNMFK